MRPLNILTWHVHGNYLYYLSQIPHRIFLPVDRNRSGDYSGKGRGFSWGANVEEVSVNDVANLDLDCILFQREAHYLKDQYEILSEKQRRLPRVYLEHDPPQGHPTNCRHWVDNPDVLLVHVTHFNQCMWDNGRTPTHVIRHGVLVPDDAIYQGTINRGLVVINNIEKRGRRLGLDIFERMRKIIPLDLVGMNSKDVGGLGEISHDDLPYFMSRYRFIFNPIRYTSMGLSVCEAMMVGLPVIAMPTTEQPTFIHNGLNGYLHMDQVSLINRMIDLINHPELASNLSCHARRYAQKYFNIHRFVNDWNSTLEQVAGSRVSHQTLIRQ